MTFIITLISLVIERFFHWSQLRYWRWFLNYQRWLSHSRIGNWPSFLLLLIGILPMILVVGAFNWLLAGWLYGILKLVFGVIVLMYCLGPANLWVQVYSCINGLNKEDPATAIERVNVAFGIGHPENSQAFHHAFTRAIFLAANRRIFAAIFWFVLLGPVGAVLYRSIALMSTESPLGFSAFAGKVLSWLDWLPVRVFTFLFALMGHFSDVLAQWKKYVLKGPETNDTLLVECGVASLDILEDKVLPEDGVAEKAAITLLDRVFVMGLVILAVVILLL